MGGEARRGDEQLDPNVGSFEVLPGGVTVSGLAHSAELAGMRVARIPSGEKTLVVTMQPGAETIVMVKEALRMVENGASQGPIVFDSGENNG